MSKRYKQSAFYSSFIALFLLNMPVAQAFSLNSLFSIFNADSASKTIIQVENIQNMEVLGDIDFEKNNKNKTFLSGTLGNDNALDSGTQLEETSNHAHDESVIYTVKKNESLQSIASYFSVSVETITTFNKLDDNKVYEGDVIEIPSISGLLYTVKKNDTIKSIATTFNLNAEDISLYNGLISELPLEIDSDIFLPGAKSIKKPEEKKKTIAKIIKSIKTTTKSGKKSDGPDVQFISKLMRDGERYANLPRLDGYFANPAPTAIRSQKMHGHNGVDLAAPIGTPIYAAAGGSVTVARDSGYNYGYGKYIVISHPNGTQTVYAHLSAINVGVGQSVGRGERIASMGNSGNSTGPHVHFEVRGAFNPFAW